CNQQQVLQGGRPWSSTSRRRRAQSSSEMCSFYRTKDAAAAESSTAQAVVVSSALWPLIISHDLHPQPKNYGYWSRLHSRRRSIRGTTGSFMTTADTTWNATK